MARVKFINKIYNLFFTFKVVIFKKLFRFEKITKDIGKGDLNTYVKLRKNDELLPLQTAFENMVENLQHKILNFKSNKNRLEFLL